MKIYRFRIESPIATLPSALQFVGDPRLKKNMEEFEITAKQRLDLSSQTRRDYGHTGFASNQCNEIALSIKDGFKMFNELDICEN